MKQQRELDDQIDTLDISSTIKKCLKRIDVDSKRTFLKDDAFLLKQIVRLDTKDTLRIIEAFSSKEIKNPTAYILKAVKTAFKDYFFHWNLSSRVAEAIEHFPPSGYLIFDIDTIYQLSKLSEKEGLGFISFIERRIRFPSSFDGLERLRTFIDDYLRALRHSDPIPKIPSEFEYTEENKVPVKRKHVHHSEYSLQEKDEEMVTKETEELKGRVKRLKERILSGVFKIDEATLDMDQIAAEMETERARHLQKTNHISWKVHIVYDELSLSFHSIGRLVCRPSVLPSMPEEIRLDSLIAVSEMESQFPSYPCIWLIVPREDPLEHFRTIQRRLQVTQSVAIARYQLMGRWFTLFVTCYSSRIEHLLPKQRETFLSKGDMLVFVCWSPTG
ncbi:hypothetical protein Gasu2_41910 [Galdieria sulphuraria]|uniref:Uncharacterized protein n=1 Tax=Galdieria sulphuraria TaxID=130081 RepID=M2VXH6_GALSU|nr:uncharacterized protein Gasu_44720 [Galdieria sulphuraria]EME27966.1 hypothetical protein Gasu_44720 [Galdieria sulphuraria]GJD09970.1 hypothetical protein Gasu2_41910 [Galdieria sulphuraria]|eukprot:XP_005704486.1 hypothetical protein Gasu_44720 [Galdieria sulphuraria]